MELLLVGQCCVVLTEPIPEIPLLQGITHRAVQLLQIEIQFFCIARLEVVVQQQAAAEAGLPEEVAYAFVFVEVAHKQLFSLFVLCLRVGFPDKKHPVAVDVADGAVCERLIQVERVCLAFEVLARGIGDAGSASGQGEQRRCERYSDNCSHLVPP